MKNIGSVVFISSLLVGTLSLSTTSYALDKRVSDFPLKNGKYTIPQIEVEVELTDNAKKQLKEFEERVLVSFYHAYNSGFVMFEEVSSTVLLPGTGGTAIIKEAEYKQKQKDIFDPNLNINVVSTTDNCTYNLLHCQFYDGDYPVKRNHRLKKKCDVIHTEPQCH